MKFVAITSELLNEEEIRGSPLLLDICQTTLAMYPADGPVHPWVGYLVADGERFVGTCAFKSPPNEEGVEIAYFTFPECEGKGVATQMARELVAIAQRSGAGVVVRAQTLPKVSASTHILEKLGFAKVGSVMHPEDGEVWEWRRE